MYQRMRVWTCRLVAAACGIVVSAALVLASAAPVLAKSFHGGAHGRGNILVQAGHIAPLHAADLIALAVAGAVACVAVVVGRRLSARKAPQAGLAGRASAQVEQAGSGRRAA
jgi:hypothetical protein